MYRRRRSALVLTSTGVVSFSFTCCNVVVWLLNKLYTTIGGILDFISWDVGGAVLSSSYCSLSERTANLFGEQKEVVAPLGGCR